MFFNYHVCFPYFIEWNPQISEEYSEPSGTSTMELFCENGFYPLTFYPLTILPKGSIVDLQLGSKCTSEFANFSQIAIVLKSNLCTTFVEWKDTTGHWQAVQLPEIFKTICFLRQKTILRSHCVSVNFFLYDQLPPSITNI